ncbi:hypothetical protein IC617_07570 [Neiella sp. HB171785]|uniref:CRISPR type III-associated protein domain-containing protein n=1 Tax=Neiella litorisoli TaxID=2771431 RepID=A0A8J6UE67_9GAMM|nr:RAMP superfamily CRISPR-associated protein [Neiella litorisoli]MBD1389279.1 hypothetical protein [Neiella litorisoli]
MKYGLLIRLDDDVILSATSATEIDHQSLDYIPGSALLGAMASAIIPQLDSNRDELIWQLFFSGAVQFGNGYPAYELNGRWQRALPVPLALHRGKYDDLTVTNAGNQILNAAAVYNMMHTKPDESAQPKQLRTGFLGADGRVVDVRKNKVTKTAINPQTGVAATSQLFNYESLASKQYFLATINIADDVPEQLRTILLSALSGRLRLGRSRGAEFGRVSIQYHELDESDSMSFDHSELTLWLVSDCYVCDTSGISTLTPSGKQIGLSAGELVLEKSFIRARSYTPFNAHRGGYETTREVIGAGSVLTYSFANCALTEQDKQLLASGLGLYQSQGLGQLVVNPAVLTTQHSLPTAALFKDVLVSGIAVQKPNDLTAKITVNSQLQAWLLGQVEQRDQLATMEDKYHQFNEAIFKHIQLARRYSVVDPSDSYGPSKTQWSRLQDWAIQAGRGASIEPLFESGGVCKPDGKTSDGQNSNNPEWVIMAPDCHNRPTPLNQFLKKELEEFDDQERANALIQIAELAQKKQWFNSELMGASL